MGSSGLLAEHRPINRRGSVANGPKKIPEVLRGHILKKYAKGATEAHELPAQTEATQRKDRPGETNQDDLQVFERVIQRDDRGYQHWDPN